MTYLQVGDSVQVRAYGQTSAGSLSLSTSASNFSVFLISGGSASGDEGSVKAWVNFDGTGTVAIRESNNVSSITDIGTGTYTVNFITAMPDMNYSISTCPVRYSGNTKVRETVLKDAISSTSSVTVMTGFESSNDAWTLENVPYVFLQICR
jgi:hypothetical protein